MKKNPKAIIVWDFDRVLFDAEKYHLDNRKEFVRLGIPVETILDTIEFIRRNKKQFSIAEFARGLRKKNPLLSEKAIRRVFKKHLLENRYFDTKVDALLHRLKRKGFVHFIVGLGSQPFQLKKIEHCGNSFRDHFTGIYITGGEKYHIIQKLGQRHKGIPIIFVDDTKSYLELAKKHVPGIITVHYSNVSGHALAKLEKQILKHAAKTK